MPIWFTILFFPIMLVLVLLTHNPDTRKEMCVHAYDTHNIPYIKRYCRQQYIISGNDILEKNDK